MWVLAFVLAPYAHLLSTARHKTEAKRFIEGVMPQLLNKALNLSEHDSDAPGLRQCSSCFPLFLHTASRKIRSGAGHSGHVHLSETFILKHWYCFYDTVLGNVFVSLQTNYIDLILEMASQHKAFLGRHAKSLSLSLSLSLSVCSIFNSSCSVWP